MSTLTKEPRNDYRHPLDMRWDERKSEIARVRPWVKAVEDGRGKLSREDVLAYQRQDARLQALVRAQGAA